MSDYGYINGAYNTPIPNRQEIKHTQVYTATHKGEGASSRLPFMNRSFISFSFSDKKKNETDEEKLVYIEDFGLVATINGDRLERKGYSEFEDLTSDYEILDGHFYWGTHYTNHELTFDLATDAMTQNELDSFLHWFQPGKVRELVLSEHPNRAVLARVAAAPELHLLPFEQPTIKKIAGQEYKTSTTLYKGEITLTFVMEEPYWYSKINIFGRYDKETGVYHDVWVDANDNKEVNIFDDPDAIKVALEDNIPIAGMIDTSMLLGDNIYANADTTQDAMTANIEIDENIKYIELIDENNEEYYELDYEHMGGTQEEIDAAIPPNSRIAGIIKENGEENWWYGARISGTIMSESSGIEEFDQNSTYYFYYAGTAPSKPTIEFRLTPMLDNNFYISNPRNKYAFPNGKAYNTITFKSLNEKELQFTTPSVYTAYNQVIKIFNDMELTANWVDIRKLIRDYVNHPAARAWANKVIDGFTDDIVDSAPNKTTALERMSLFLKDENGSLFSSTFSINSKTGRAIGQLKYREPDATTPSEVTWASYGVKKVESESELSEDQKYLNMIHEEDVGDMIRSNYLIIEDQNQPTEDGHIVAWQDGARENKLHSHAITHDVENGLENVFVKYQNMYL